MPLAKTESRPGLDAAASPLSKQSFLKLPVKIDHQRLLADYRSIPAGAWTTSHWNIHCSSNMLLLRGGKNGDAGDFTTDMVADNDILKSLPYLASLIADDGPFGGARYAFLFRMKPMGVARVHRDDDPAWKTPFRIHIPIITNDDAFLLAQGRAKHLGAGEVWTFDNQSLHAVSNGDTVRTHLIMDVLPNPKLNALLEKSAYDPGVLAPELWARTLAPKTTPPMLCANAGPLSAKEKIELGLNPEGFAARIERRHLISQLTRAPLQRGDIVYAVNGVEDCEVARTAIDYIQLRHLPGEVLNLDIVRNASRQKHRLRLYRNPIPQPLRKALWSVKSMINRPLGTAN